MTFARILVVEDEGIVALDIKNRLERLGYIVAGLAATGEEAIALTENTTPNLVLMDVKLRGNMDGVEAAEKIRERFGVPVIYITAFADEETLQRARVTEAFGYVLKPFEERELVTNIEIALYKHGMEQTLRAREEHFRTLIENANDLIVVLSPDLTILYGSPSVERVLGYTLEDYIRQSALNFCHPEDLQAIIETVQCALSKPETPHTLEHRIRSKDGRWRYFVSTGKCLQDESGAASLVVNCHDITERKQSEEFERQQRRLAEVLREISVELNSSLGVNAVLDRLLHQIARVVHYDSGCVLLLEGDMARIVRTAGYEKFGLDPQEVMENLVIDVKAAASFREMIASGKPLVIPDTTASPGWIFHRESQHIRSMAGAPMIVQGAVLGFITLNKVEPDFYKPEHSEQLGLFAAQAGLALQNARLFEAAQRAAKENQTLREAAAAVTSALELDQVLDHILTQLERVIPYHSAAIFLREADQVQIVAGRGFPDPNRVIGTAFSIDDPLLQEAMRARAPLILADAQSDPRFQGWCGTTYTRGWLGVPLIVRDELIGFLTLDSTQPNAYGESECSLASAFANQAAIAIDNARLFRQVHQLAITDSLTGIYNRRHFFDLANKEFERARRYGRSLALIMWDIDHFKIVNDTFGHLVGDQVLKVVAERSRKHLREIDLLARYGGEEFVALLPEVHLNAACEVGERLRAAIGEHPILVGEHEVRITVSIGMAILDDGCPNVEILLDRADQALYQAKNAGRNRVEAWIDLNIKSVKFP